ncbi:para-nitrobenzyl esterase-like isoform X1 [Nematostella vectensis]|uniref:para-nitrobenzyl esterase-like isoform X1 n=1 Tax=Nematostella vectensis TaxID=45351 RepID=UPI002076DDF0|nr:para-nitrobenzyl esterase-like isoform X1 [Nematostella vectensis]
MEDVKILARADSSAIAIRDTKANTVKKVRNIIIVVLILSTVIFIAVLIALLIRGKSSENDENNDEDSSILIATDGGTIRGTRNSNAWVFKGIPYAKPPINDMRWKPPFPCGHNHCWQGTFNAAFYGKVCPQLNSEDQVIGSEDCLYLNVWTPSVDIKQPVLVFIHGGDLTYGSGHDRGIHPTPEFVSNLGVVGISFNYRLNAFGFLSLDALSDGSKSNTSGNYGFMDQIMALSWIHTNIARFGGDPDRVILLGQSSGATSSLALLVSPLANGLFHGAILMSASPVFSKSANDASSDNKVFVERMGCAHDSLASTRECLYRSNVARIIQKSPWNVYPYWSMPDLTDLPTPGFFSGALATVDGHVVPYPPFIALSSGRRINDVPIILGTTAQEIDYLPGKLFNTKADLSDFKRYASERLSRFLSDAEIEKVFSMYLVEHKHPRLSYANIVTDIRVTCPTRVLAVGASTGLRSVYRYVVTNWPSKPVTLVGDKTSAYAFHMWDLLAFFGFPEAFGYSPSARDKRFMVNLRRELGRFIHSNKVESSGWKPYPEVTALFTDGGLDFARSYLDRECDLWLGHGLFPYGWVN